MSRILCKLLLVDVDDYSGDSNREEIIEIDDKNIDKLEDLYSLYDNFWLGREYYDTYEDYCEEFDENDIVKDHFDIFLDVVDDWSLDTLISLFKEIYPNEYIEIKDFNTLVFRY